MVENVKYPYRRFLVFSAACRAVVPALPASSSYLCHGCTTIAERQADFLSIFVAFYRSIISKNYCYLFLITFSYVYLIFLLHFSYIYTFFLSLFIIPCIYPLYYVYYSLIAVYYALTLYIHTVFAYLYCYLYY